MNVTNLEKIRKDYQQNANSLLKESNGIQLNNIKIILEMCRHKKVQTLTLEYITLYNGKSQSNEVPNTITLTRQKRDHKDYGSFIEKKASHSGDFYLYAKNTNPLETLSLKSKDSYTNKLVSLLLETVKEFKFQTPTNTLTHIMREEEQKEEKKITLKPQGENDYLLISGLNNSAPYNYYLINDLHRELQLKTSRLIIDFNNTLKESLNNQRRYISDYYDSHGQLHQKDLDIFNNEDLKLVKVYKKDLDKEIEEKINKAFQDIIAESKDEEEGSFQILEFLEFKHNLTSSFLGLEKLEEQGNNIEIVYPAGKDNGLYLKVKLRVRINAKGLRKTTNLSIAIKDFKIKDLVHIKHQRDGSVQVITPEKVTVEGRVDIDFSNSILDFIISSIEKIFDPLSKEMKETVAETLSKEIHDALKDIKRLSEMQYGDVERLDIPKEDTFDAKEEVTQKIEDVIFDMHLPYASMAIPRLKETDYRSWKDYTSIENNPLPEVVGYAEMHDGAIWTGTFLTSMALKASLTNNHDDYKRINTLLEKINILATINGKGPLARSAFPINSNFSKKIPQVEKYKTMQVNGETWIAFQGESGISRDQYVGVMTGLINTFILVNDEEIKEKAKNIYKHLFDYLVDNDWMIFEDSKRETSFSQKNFPTTWAGIGYQKVTYLKAATLMFPENEKYKEEYQAYFPLIKLTWLNSFLAGVEPWESYYSLNLEHTTLFSLLLMIDHPDLLKHIGSALDTFNFYAKYHHNPYFEAIRYFGAMKLKENQIDSPYSLSEISRNIEQEYNDIYYRRHTMNTLPEGSQDYRKDVLSIHHRFTSLSGKSESIPNQAIPSRLRYSETNFLWQRTPFQSGYFKNYYNERDKASGLDVHILHWLIKFLKF